MKADLNILWHPWPLEAPPDLSTYLVTRLNRFGGRYLECRFFGPRSSGMDMWGLPKDRSDGCVLAWCEIPEPYDPNPGELPTMQYALL